jgi:hypothetical protein
MRLKHAAKQETKAIFQKMPSMMQPKKQRMLEMRIARRVHSNARLIDETHLDL